MDSSKHTPTPWHIDRNISSMIVDQTGRMLANTLGSGFDAKADRANAAFIVRAVNSHDQLVAALKKVKDHGGICSSSTLEAVCAALAAAGA